jgi:hypothetical protein
MEMSVCLTALLLLSGALLYLFVRRNRLKKEYRRLLEKYREAKDELEALQFQESGKEKATIDKLAAHDAIVSMHQAGADTQTIARELKIPESKVEMTLKFEKMKRNGA